MCDVAFVTPGQADANFVIYQPKVVYKFIAVAGSNQLYFCADNILLMYFETTFRSLPLSLCLHFSLIICLMNPQQNDKYSHFDIFSNVLFSLFFLFLHISFVCFICFCFQFYLNVSFKLMIFLFEFAFRYCFLSLNVA